MLYATRAGSLLPNKAIFVVLNVVINFFRPIPFIIFIAAVQPLSRMVIGTGIGINARHLRALARGVVRHRPHRRAEPRDGLTRRHRGGAVDGSRAVPHPLDRS